MKNVLKVLDVPILSHSVRAAESVYEGESEGGGEGGKGEA